VPLATATIGGSRLRVSQRCGGPDVGLGDITDRDHVVAVMSRAQCANVIEEHRPDVSDGTLARVDDVRSPKTSC
jgi:hypothetical protein